MAILTESQNPTQSIPLQDSLASARYSFSSSGEQTMATDKQNNAKKAWNIVKNIGKENPCIPRAHRFSKDRLTLSTKNRSTTASARTDIILISPIIQLWDVPMFQYFIVSIKFSTEWILYYFLGVACRKKCGFMVFGLVGWDTLDDCISIRNKIAKKQYL